jgi:hypothetical protein
MMGMMVSESTLDPTAALSRFLRVLFQKPLEELMESKRKKGRRELDEHLDIHRR